MNIRRLGLVARNEIMQNFRRPMIWVLIGLLAFLQWSLASGSASIQVSGDASVGGKEQWLTGMFTVAQMLTALLLMLYAFFVTIGAGMTIIRDDEVKINDLLQGTPLTPGEYIWGKYIGSLISFLLVLVAHIGSMILFLHVLPTAAEEVVGPFELGNYLMPALYFGVPTVIFLSGVAFALGELARRPIVIFTLPIFLVILCTAFLWNWSPSWLDPRINQFMMLIDPTGYRWLLETFLKVDRGVDFYNTQAITFEGTFGILFLLSRIAYLFIGVLPVFFCTRHFTRKLRAMKHGNLESSRGFIDRMPRFARGMLRFVFVKRPRNDSMGSNIETRDPNASLPLGLLGMINKPIGLLGGILTVARFELKELKSHPGLYLFTPFIISQTLGTALMANGAFDTPMLLTSGSLAIGTMNTLTLLVCMLLLFYTVESQQREHHTKLAPIYFSTAIRSSSIIFGKTIANAVVGIVVLLAALLGCGIAMLIQGSVGFDIFPYFLVWGILLVPTYMLWCAFITMLVAILRNRYTVYAIGIGVFIFTFYRQFTGQMNWVGNWNLWSFSRWSDISTFEFGRSAIILNRILALSMTVLLTAITVRFFNRREWDASRIVHRLRPGPLFKMSMQMLPFIIVPLVSGGILWAQVNDGFQGDKTLKKQKDYWKQNLATYNDTPIPAITEVVIDLELDPARQWFKVSGTYTFHNPNEKPMRQIPFTGAQHWENMAWTMNGEPYEPEDRTRLFVFTPPQPLETDESMSIGFSHEGYFPNGISKNGGGNMEFIVPSGVVLTSFSPSFVPVPGYMSGIGVDEDNQFDSREYQDDFFEGITPSAFGSQTRFTTKATITGPDDFMYNAPGTLLSDESVDGLRTVVWESDFPVTFFNVVAGRWDVKEGNGTKIFYHPEHHYNIEEMSSALDAARKYYSEWFMEYPWAELKISEFPNLAGYAQGFATNITFSEGIGFLTKSDPESNVAYMVVAHETAHQWWGNLLRPGKGPGGNILSEGMAHFSTLLLIEADLGLRERIGFAKQIESRYGDARRVDAERPLVKIDGSKNGDNTVTYDKGGFVFWMLLNHMGRENALAGCKEFITSYLDDEDCPVLQDFIRVMRPFAPDAEAYDAFTQQWFHEVVMPEYRFSDVVRNEWEPGQWEVTFTIENKGTGTMPLEIALTKGERFPDAEASVEEGEEEDP
ncbi:MAG: M1 family aminopeptidase, partial [Planctomycetota bacterium]|nr:M1 family aminopeptidase [Planctomycetota bacterium]